MERLAPALRFLLDLSDSAFKRALKTHLFSTARHPAPLRRLHDSGAGYKYSDTCTSTSLYKTYLLGRVPHWSLRMYTITNLAVSVYISSGQWYGLAVNATCSTCCCIQVLVTSLYIYVQMCVFSASFREHAPIRTNDTLWGKCIVGKIRAS